MGPRDIHSLSPEEHARLAHRVMRRQAWLSLRVAAAFLVIILGLPVVNYCWPEIAGAKLFGFPASWLFLGVLFYPVSVVLSAYFIRESNHIEDSCADWRDILDAEAST